MIDIDTIYCGSCLDIANEIKDVDVVLTSPFYNTAGKALLDPEHHYERIHCANSRKSQYARYDVLIDDMTTEQYCGFMVDLFNKMHDGLKDTGVVLFNISYSVANPDGYIFAVSEIMRNTDFRLVDQISWKKPSCIPDISSTNRLTRLVEPVFVFCKKGCEKTFYMNKIETGKGNATHKCYKPIWNIVEAKTSDGKCPYNKATFSVDLCRKLLSMYAPENGLVFDPFMGSGTTAVACKEMRLHYIGSEISENQVKWANDRIAQTKLQLDAESSELVADLNN